MPKTIVEKILAARCCCPSLSAGKIIEAEPDWVMIHESIGWGLKDILDDLGASAMAYPDRIVTILDHYAPPPSAAAAMIQKVSRDYALEHFPKHYHDMRRGICHQVMLEDYASPGQIIVGSDSHTTTYGAFGCFATCLGYTDIALTMVNGKNWFKVPQSILFELTGQLPAGVGAKDIMLQLLKELGADGATYMACEFTGSGLSSLSMESRICLCNMCSEMGAKAALMPVDQITKDYLAKLGRPVDESALYEADEDAVYHKKVTVNLSTLSPLVAIPHSPDNVVTLEDVPNVMVDQVFIGGCVNGRIEDMRAAAEVLRGKTLHKRMRLIIVPASHKIMKQMAEEGLLQEFLDIGAVVTPSNCGPCFGGHNGMLADAEVCVSTGTRNFIGRMGSKNAFIYLASPQTAAATAINGCISDPRKFLSCEGV